MRSHPRPAASCWYAVRVRSQLVSRWAIPASVASYRALRPLPCWTYKPSFTSRRRHERTCSEVCPHASATAYSSDATISPSSWRIPDTSTLVGIGTVVRGTTES